MRRRIFALALLAGSCRCAREAPPLVQTEAPPAAPASSGPTQEPPASAPEPSDAGSADASGAAALAALEASAPLAALEVPGFRDAVVSLPIGATEPRPVVVALHGNYDRPEWQCDVWRAIVGDRAFVLCPRGVPRADAPKGSDRWTYSAVGQTERELLAALEALEQRWPEHVDDGPVLFTGFSLGAILGVHLLKKHPAKFPRAVLTEGGYKGWSYALAKAYQAGGGQRVLFACAQAACAQAAKSAMRIVEKQGLFARLADAGNVGHTYDGPVAQAIASELEWLLEGDERWSEPD